jgi:hypothetical protein
MSKHRKACAKAASVIIKKQNEMIMDAQIAAGKAEIQAEWSEEVRRQRMGLRPSAEAGYVIPVVRHSSGDAHSVDFS